MADIEFQLTEDYILILVGESVVMRLDTDNAKKLRDRLTRFIILAELAEAPLPKPKPPAEEHNLSVALRQLRADYNSLLQKEASLKEEKEKLQEENKRLRKWAAGKLTPAE